MKMETSQSLGVCVAMGNTDLRASQHQMDFDDSQVTKTVTLSQGVRFLDQSNFKYVLV